MSEENEALIIPPLPYSDFVREMLELRARSTESPEQKAEREAFKTEYYERFQSAVHAWTARFGLTEWTIGVAAKHFPPWEQGAIAHVSCDRRHQNAQVEWNKSFPYEPPFIYEEPEYVALHEVLHIVLDSLMRRAGGKKRWKKKTLSAEHAVIHRLVYALLAAEQSIEDAERYAWLKKNASETILTEVFYDGATVNLNDGETLEQRLDKVIDEQGGK